MTMPEGQKWDYATRPEVEGCREGSWGLISWSKKLQASCRLLSKPLHTVISRDIYQASITWVLMNWHWHTLQEDSEQVDLADDTTAQQAVQVILFQKYFYFRQLTPKNDIVIWQKFYICCVLFTFTFIMRHAKR